MPDIQPLTHVLYVDDDPDMRMLLQLTLESMGGIRVTLCDSAISLLESAIEDSPQMIILDAVMPDMDGPSILKALRDDPRLSSIPVIFLTGRSDAENVKAFEVMGAVGVIAKPFNLVAISEEVLSLWKKSHQ